MVKNELLCCKQSLILQWLIGDTATGTSPYLDKCNPERVMAVFSGIRLSSQWSKKQQDLHIKQLKLLAIKFAILKFSKSLKIPPIIDQGDSSTALSYVPKMEEAKYPLLKELSEDIWIYHSSGVGDQGDCQILIVTSQW